MPAMHPTTLSALASFPGALEQHYSAFPREFVHWAPSSWDGVPSEPFTAIEQICHVRDYRSADAARVFAEFRDARARAGA
jgi:hypothetical protein